MGVILPGAGADCGGAEIGIAVEAADDFLDESGVDAAPESVERLYFSEFRICDHEAYHNCFHISLQFARDFCKCLQMTGWRIVPK